MPKPNPQKFMSPQYEDYKKMGGTFTLWLIVQIYVISMSTLSCIENFMQGNFAIVHIGSVVYAVLASISLILLFRRKYSFRIIFFVAEFVFSVTTLPWPDFESTISRLFIPLLFACYPLCSARVAVYCGRF